MNCKCKKPSNVYNGVCGKCLLPLKGFVHGEDGAIIQRPRTMTPFRTPQESKKLIDRFIEVEMRQLEYEYPAVNRIAQLINPYLPESQELACEILIQRIISAIEMVEEIYGEVCPHCGR